MSFPLSPVHLAHMYDCLRQLPPFSEWKLPESDEVEFHTPQSRDAGKFTAPNVIMVSSLLHGHFDSIVKTLALEMCHMSEGLKDKNLHGREWQRKARRVCNAFGWDYRAF